WAHFFRGLVAYGEDEIHLRRSWSCELIPILAAQAIHGQARDSKLIECLWPHEPRGMATRTVGFEAGRSFLIENRFSHDRPSRIPCAKEHDVVAALHRSRALRFGGRTTGRPTTSA